MSHAPRLPRVLVATVLSGVLVASVALVLPVERAAAAPSASTAVTPPRTFTLAPVPTIAGTARVGSTATARPGTWTAAPALAYQWTRNGVAIAGATAATYKFAAADAGLPVRVRVTATKAGYSTLAKTSAAIVPLNVFTKTGAPTVTGTMTAAAVLTATVPTWTPAASDFTYQWKRNGVAIVGATAKTYRVLPTDVDRSITVSVVGTRSAYASGTSTSTGRVAAGIAYPNCAALNLVYPHGVARIGITADKVSGVAKPLGAKTFFSTTLYNLNPARDGDKDGVACEKH